MPRRRGRKSAYKALLRKALKAFLVSPVDAKCQSCGYNQYIGNLAFHHKDKRTKMYNISSSLLLRPLKTLIKEASKCMLICHNCHGEVHAGIRSVKKIPLIDYTSVRVPSDVIKWYSLQRSRRD